MRKLILVVFLFIFNYSYSGQMYSGYPGLIGLWHLNEGTGTTSIDSSASKNNITFVSGGAWATGKFGKAFVSDGTAYMETNTSYNLTLTSYVTVGAWIYPTQTVPASTYPFIMDKANYRLYLDPSENTYTVDVLGMIRIGGSQKYVGTCQALVNKWTFAMFTYNKDAGGNNFLLYLNGELCSASRQTGNIDPSTQNLRFAWQSYYGKVEECMVLNRALSAGEIKRMYEEMIDRYTNNND